MLSTSTTGHDYKSLKSVRVNQRSINCSSSYPHVTAADCGGRISFREPRANNNMWLPFLSSDKQQHSATASSFAFTYLRLKLAVDSLLSHHLSFPYSPGDVARSLHVTSSASTETATPGFHISNPKTTFPDPSRLPLNFSIH